MTWEVPDKLLHNPKLRWHFLLLHESWVVNVHLLIIFLFRIIRRKFFQVIFQPLRSFFGKSKLGLNRHKVLSIVQLLKWNHWCVDMIEIGLILVITKCLSTSRYLFHHKCSLSSPLGLCDEQGSEPLTPLVDTSVAPLDLLHFVGVHHSLLPLVHFHNFGGGCHWLLDITVVSGSCPCCCSLFSHLDHGSPI